jgi:hypothetical protein
MNATREATGLFLFSTPILVILYDLVADEVGGNEATISKLMLDTYTAHPAFGWNAVFLTMMLIGHLFFPTYTQTAGWREYTAFAIILANYGVCAWNLYGELHGKKMAVSPGSVWAWLKPELWVAVAGSLGLATGRFLVPQHLVKS